MLLPGYFFWCLIITIIILCSNLFINFSNITFTIFVRVLDTLLINVKISNFKADFNIFCVWNIKNKNNYIGLSLMPKQEPKFGCNNKIHHKIEIIDLTSVFILNLSIDHFSNNILRKITSRKSLIMLAIKLFQLMSQVCIILKS